MKSSTLTILLFLTFNMFSQDTIVKHIIKKEQGLIERLEIKTIVDGKVIKKVVIDGNTIYVTESINLSDTWKEQYHYNLETHIPEKDKNKPEYNPIALVSMPIFDDSSRWYKDSFYLGEYPHPCQCLLALSHSFFEPDIDCISRCKFDTLRLRHTKVKYNVRGDLDSVFYLNEDSTILGEVRLYNEDGMKTACFTSCDTFLTEYNTKGQKSKEEYVYSCDDFRYQAEYEYHDSTTMVYSVRNGIRSLSSKKMDRSDGTFQKTVYFSDSTITITVYEKDTEKELSKEKWLNRELKERWVYVYLEKDGINQTIITLNDKEKYRIIEKTVYRSQE